MKYVLYGAGKIGEVALAWLGKEKVAYFLDNSETKQGTELNGVPIHSFEEKKQDIKNHQLILTMKEAFLSEVKGGLKENEINEWMTLQDLRQKIIKEQHSESVKNLEVFHRAVAWIKENSFQDRGIITTTQNRVPYPEVSGYFIPTLLYWGYRDLAITYAKWLCSIQNEDGSFMDSNNKTPYVFDTAQIMKGLLAIRNLLPDVDEYIIRGCNWLVSRINGDGRFLAFKEDIWGDGSTYSELIHLYCLSPIMEAGKAFSIPMYEEAVSRCKNYYLKNEREKILDFHLLSHFYAYVIEGLLDLSETDLAHEAMNHVAEIQDSSGAVPGYKNQKWICSTGLFQFSLIWFRLGEIDRGEKAFRYACKLQNKTGGWYGSYLSPNALDEGNDYFPFAEISWANKYFLDALRYRGEVTFDAQADSFLNYIDKDSSAYQTIRKVVSTRKEKMDSPLCIAEVGCGKGRYVKALLEDYPKERYTAIDISEKVMSYIDDKSILILKGSLTCIPALDRVYDITYTCEALEHAIAIENAIREMARVTKRGGVIIVLDKYKEMADAYIVDEWEQYFDEFELKTIMLNYCRDVQVIHGIDHVIGGQGMTAWIGEVM